MPKLLRDRLRFMDMTIHSIENIQTDFGKAISILKIVQSLLHTSRPSQKLSFVIEIYFVMSTCTAETSS